MAAIDHPALELLSILSILPFLPLLTDPFLFSLSRAQRSHWSICRCSGASVKQHRGGGERLSCRHRTCPLIDKVKHSLIASQVEARWEWFGSQSKRRTDSTLMSCHEHPCLLKRASCALHSTPWRVRSYTLQRPSLSQSKGTHSRGRRAIRTQALGPSAMAIGGGGVWGQITYSVEAAIWPSSLGISNLQIGAAGRDYGRILDIHKFKLARWYIQMEKRTPR